MTAVSALPRGVSTRARFSPTDYPARAGRPLRARGGGGDAREGGLLRRARPLGRRLPRPRAHVLQGHRRDAASARSPGRRRHAGGYLNASTTYDHTTYFTVLPASGLEAALDIQSDALRHSVIDADELGRELQVIIQEAKRKLDTPVRTDARDAARSDVRPAPDPPVAHRPGEPARRLRASRPLGLLLLAIRARAHHRGHRGRGGRRRGPRRWRAGRTVIGHPPPAPSTAHPRSRRAASVRARTLRGDVTAPSSRSAGGRWPALHPDTPALDLAAAILGAGRGSRLYRRLREPGIASWVAAHHYSPTELGVMSVSAELAPDRVDETLAGIAETVTQLALLGPSWHDLERARTLVRARWARRMESMEGRAASLAEAEALDGYELLDREYAALGEVEPAEVRRRRKDTCRPTRSRVCLPSAHRGHGAHRATLARAFAVDAPRSRWRLPPASRSASRPPLAVRSRREANVVHMRASRCRPPGLEETGVPLVTLGIYVPRRRFDPPEQAGIGALTVGSAARGAGGLDAGGLAFAFERLGGTLGAERRVRLARVRHDGARRASGRRRRRSSTRCSASRISTRRSVGLERGIMVAEAEQVTDDMFRYPFQLAFARASASGATGCRSRACPVRCRPSPLRDVRRWHQRRICSRRGRSSSPSATWIPTGHRRCWPGHSGGGARSPPRGRCPSWSGWGSGRRPDSSGS